MYPQLGAGPPAVGTILQDGSEVIRVFDAGADGTGVTRRMPGGGEITTFTSYEFQPVDYDQQLAEAMARAGVALDASRQFFFLADGARRFIADPRRTPDYRVMEELYRINPQHLKLGPWLELKRQLDQVDADFAEVISSTEAIRRSAPPSLQPVYDRQLEQLRDARNAGAQVSITPAERAALRAEVAAAAAGPRPVDSVLEYVRAAAAAPAIDEYDTLLQVFEPSPATFPAPAALLVPQVSPTTRPPSRLFEPLTTSTPVILDTPDGPAPKTTRTGMLIAAIGGAWWLWRNRRGPRR